MDVNTTTMISVDKQIEILLKSNTIESCLEEDKGIIPVQIIFMTPKISMNKNVIDINNRIWTHVPDSYFYKNDTGFACPIFYINKCK